MKHSVAAIALLGACGFATVDALAAGQSSGSTRAGRRMTMAFTPEVNIQYGEPPGSQIRAKSKASDPFELAMDFSASVLELEHPLAPTTEFFFRNDSYTDANTGVTHVYIRQHVHGLEILNADMNVNVKDGQVISYGNSLYTGQGLPIPESVDIQRDYCFELIDQLRAAYMIRNANQDLYAASEDTQHPFPEDPDHSDELEDNIMRLSEIYSWNCEYASSAYRPATRTQRGFNDELGSLEPALLQFMINASPDRELSGKLIEQWDSILARGLSDKRILGFPNDERPWESRFEVRDVPGAVGNVKARLAYVQVPHEGQMMLARVWQFIVRMENNWYEAAVTVSAPYRILSVVDWVADAPHLPAYPSSVRAPIPTPHFPGNGVYRVFRWGVNDPSAGPRSLESVKPDLVASPLGWHVFTRPRPGFEETTAGNNVFAQENWSGESESRGNYRPQGTYSSNQGVVFDFAYDPKRSGGGGVEDAKDEAKRYVNASITQIFYTANMVHDLYYRYGFDESAGNFQEFNFGRGGEENDAVVIDAQHGSGMNNADFATPPDGEAPHCRMFLWDTADPYRDGAFEAGVVIHELSHGLSIRLTGGPQNSLCLGAGESAGMGEGWGDFFATMIRSVEVYQDYTMGAWVYNNPKGIRRYPYSLDMDVNPTTYKSLDSLTYWEPHAIGEVWAEILWVVAQKLINKHGFSSTLFPPQGLPDWPSDDDFYRQPSTLPPGAAKRVPKHGNTLAVQLVINGLKMQPCMPSFFAARDAIIDADQALTGGENFCELWKGFADRGLGPKARVFARTPWGGGFRTNDFNPPSTC